jgi:two-component system cell cycle sensor histidine kinase/response regulator CckA
MQTVGRLAGGIAHDFNNLLTAIIGFCDLLLQRHHVGDPSFADINQIRQNATRAANLTGQLLAFSRRQNLVPKVLNLTDLMSDTSSLLRRLLGEKIDYEFTYEHEDGRIKADEGQITQVLTNLVVNARDAIGETSENGTGKVTVRTMRVGPDEVRALGHSFMPPGNYELIEVSDTGGGIPEEIRVQIFEPFFTTKATGEGTGLGLSTVYGIVKQTGGFVFVDSDLGVGTTFRIYLPSYEGDEKAASEEAVRDEPASDTTGQGVVLLVEDETAVRAFASRALTMRGYTVLEAEDGEDALRVFADYDGPIDLVVSDVVMPGLDGPGLVEQLRAGNPELKVVFMSGYAEDSFRKQLEESGGEVHFLPKPFSLPQLAGMVRKVMGAEDEAA